VSTIGFEQRHNVASRIEDEEAFVRAMSTDIPPPPPLTAEFRGQCRTLAGMTTGWVTPLIRLLIPRPENGEHNEEGFESYTRGGGCGGCPDAGFALGATAA
jgi:hypothetical protein